MNYKNLYDKLIDSRRLLSRDCYVEKHHILPRSLGGSNDKDNIISLTAREHFIAHLFLSKIYGGKMWMALSYMSRKNTKSANGVKINSRIYQLIKEKDSEFRSKSFSGENNPWYGKVIPEEFRKKMRGHRPSVSGENNYWYGKKRPDTSVVISFVRSYKINTVIDDRFIKLINNNTGIDKSSELLKLIQHYRRSESIRNNYHNRKSTTGKNNPNYGNGQAITGSKNPMYGKKQSESAKKKISENTKKRIVCLHCGKEGNIANMHRWHFDNCKQKLSYAS